MELAKLAALMSAHAMTIPIGEDRFTYRYDTRSDLRDIRRRLDTLSFVVGKRRKFATKRPTVKANRAANVRRMQRGA